MIRLEFDDARNIWCIDVATADGGRESFTARHVISSAPLRELVERIKPVPISLLHARALRYRDFLTVALMVRKDGLFPDNWIYIHDPSVKVGRVQNFRSWSPEMVPEGMSCLGLEYFCFEGDGLWNAPDSELIALAKKEIAQIGLVTADEVIDACVVRQAKAYPVYDEDYRDNVAAIRLDLEGSYPTLHMVGRNGMHKYNNQDHAMMTAMLTARNILAGTAALRRVERQRGCRISRSGRVRRAAGARQRAAGSGEGRRPARCLAGPKRIRERTKRTQVRFDRHGPDVASVAVRQPPHQPGRERDQHDRRQRNPADGREHHRHRQRPDRDQQPMVAHRVVGALAQQRDHEAEHHHVVIENVGREEKRRGDEERKRERRIAALPIGPHHRGEGERRRPRIAAPSRRSRAGASGARR